MNEHGISKKIIKPENCIIAFGIPTSKEKFGQHQLSKNSDFVKKFASWSQYHYQFVSNMERLSPIITELGVSVIYNLKLGDFETLFNKNEVDVIVLFSHWSTNSIEFDDGIADLHSIVNKIPLDFYGILDLCVCHPEELTKMLRKYRPNCLVKYTHKKATPFLWIYFYMVLFKYLKDYDVTYLEALEKIIKEFLTNNKRKFYYEAC